jgi:uncharacterized protein (UPF0264 family)
MTKLLVSVRNVDEALAAVAGGADLIDIKEPDRGPLGAADPAVWVAIRQAIGYERPLSVALGELWEPDLAERLRHASLADYAKVGLSGCASRETWQRDWCDQFAALDVRVQRVAVIYADAEACGAPQPQAILDTATTLGCRTVLIDTFAKSHGNLLTYFSLSRLKELLRHCRERQLQLALAGSLNEALFGCLRPLEIDWLALRGAVCEGGRTGRVSRQRVAQFVELLAHPSEILTEQPVSA